MFPEYNSATVDKPALQQWWEIANWGSRLVTAPREYKAYGLHLQGRTKHDALRYITNWRMAPVLERLNRDPAILEDKLIFNSRFGGSGLPVPELVAVVGWHPAAGKVPVLRNSPEVSSYLTTELGRGEQLVIKQLSGRQGMGVLVLTDLRQEEGEALAILSNGKARPLTEIAKGLQESGGTWLIERRVEQNAVLDQLNSTSVNTIRLATLRRQGGNVEVPYAVLRVGRLTSQVDAYSAGGIAVRVDVETGQLASWGHMKGSVEPLSRHPDSGIEFRGCAIPYWAETLDVARRFAARAGDNRFVGWDIAMTPDGPLFIEGNHSWGVHVAQIGSEGMLTSHMVETLRSEAGVSFDTRRLPLPKPLQAIRLLLSRSY